MNHSHPIQHAKLLLDQYETDLKKARYSELQLLDFIRSSGLGKSLADLRKAFQEPQSDPLQKSQEQLCSSLEKILADHPGGLTASEAVSRLCDNQNLPAFIDVGHAVRTLLSQLRKSGVIVRGEGYRYVLSETCSQQS